MRSQNTNQNEKKCKSMCAQGIIITTGFRAASIVLSDEMNSFHFFFLNIHLNAVDWPNAIVLLLSNCILSAHKSIMKI